MVKRSHIIQLPKEILPNTTWRKVLLLILLTLVMLLITNLFLMAYLDKYSMNYGYWTIHQKWNLLADLESPVDWLIFGDSSCSQGVIPDIIQNELRQTAINLCTTGDMGTVDNLWQLEEYIERFGPPKNVLMVHTFDIWHRNFNPARLGQIPRPWKFWDDHTFGYEFMFNEDTRKETFIEHYMPIISQNRTITLIIRSLFAGKLNPFNFQWKMTESGFVPAYEAKPDIVLAGEQQQIEFATENKFSVSSIYDQALQEIVDLADKYDFQVYLANSPVSEGLFANTHYQDYNRSLQTYLQNISSQSPNIHHLASVKTFPPEKMQNPDHLILSGAEEYTHWLVEQILQVER